MEHQKTMRFEKGNLFIEIEKDNQLIFIRNGEIGEKGNEETKSFKSFEEVETFFNNEISRLISENYIEIKCETDTNSILAGEIAEDLKLGIDLILKALNGNFEPLFEFVKSAFNIILLDTKVMEYIKSTLNMRKINGPLSFAGFRESFKYKFSFDKLWGIGSQEKMFPAIQVASETYGHYFFMMLETGNVIAMHHDDLSYNAEEPWTTSEEDEDKFCSLLEADFFLCNIQQLICFQKETEQIEDFEIEAVATINALTSCFNISMENLMELSTSIPFAFLNLDKQLISNLISSKKSFKQLKTNAAEIIDLDLSNLNLRELPNEISKCTSLEFIDLSNNSALDFQKTFNSLTALKKLSIIKINNNNLTDLPSGIDQLKQVIKISLANNSIAEIGENWKNLSHLQVIDLKENSISDLLKDLIQRYLPNTEIITKNRERKLLKSFDDIFEQIHKDLPNLQEYEKVETIWFNNAKKVEINLEEFRNLKHLKLSGYDQALEELPANIGQLIKLETLSISIQDKLNFEETVQVASNLTGLKRLELFSLKPAKTLPESLTSLQNLEDFELGNQLINDWDNSLITISKLKKLKRLSIVCSEIGKLRDCISELKNLEEIHFDKIELDSTFEILSKLPNLTDVFFNQRFFDPVSIPESIGKLVNLRQLMLFRNPGISDLPESMKNLQKLEILDIRMCPISKSRINQLERWLPNCEILTD